MPFGSFLKIKRKRIHIGRESIFRPKEKECIFVSRDYLIRGEFQTFDEIVHKPFGVLNAETIVFMGFGEKFIVLPNRHTVFTPKTPEFPTG